MSIFCHRTQLLGASHLSIWNEATIFEMQQDHEVAKTSLSHWGVEFPRSGEIHCRIPAKSGRSHYRSHPLDYKESHKVFPTWTAEHNFTFESIKTLVCSVECLTIINHVNPGDKNVYLTCDTSHWRTGAMLSFGSMWETAWPIAFNSAQLSTGQKSYPVHEKELLAIVWALKKWRSDLMGSPIYVYTDHKTLINFDAQCDLSCRQLRWQELLSQYEIHILYIHGEDNTVVDALSCLPADNKERVEPYHMWSSGVSATFAISTDASALHAIMDGYSSDPFSQKLCHTDVPGAKLVNGLWYIGSHLLIPRVGDVWEQLYHLAHDTLGTLDWTSCMPHWRMITTGPTCNVISRRLTSPPVLTANEINLPTPNCQVPCIPCQSRMNGVILLQWISWDLSKRTWVSIVSSLLQIVWVPTSG